MLRRTRREIDREVVGAHMMERAENETSVYVVHYMGIESHWRAECECAWTGVSRQDPVRALADASGHARWPGPGRGLED